MYNTKCRRMVVYITINKKYMCMDGLLLCGVLC